MKFIFTIIKNLTMFLLKLLINYIDKNSDGKISIEEAEDFIKQIKNIIERG